MTSTLVWYMEEPDPYLMENHHTNTLHLIDCSAFCSAYFMKYSVRSLSSKSNKIACRLFNIFGVQPLTGVADIIIPFPYFKQRQTPAV